MCRVEPKLKTKRKKKLSPRKLVEMTIKEIDHTVCGPACRKVPTPPEVEALNKEFKHLFPKDVPSGIPPSRRTDHRIDLVDGARIPAQRLYRMAPKEDEELQRQLKDLQDKALHRTDQLTLWLRYSLCAEGEWEVTPLRGLSPFEPNYRG